MCMYSYYIVRITYSCIYDEYEKMGERVIVILCYRTAVRHCVVPGS